MFFDNLTVFFLLCWLCYYIIRASSGEMLKKIIDGDTKFLSLSRKQLNFVVYAASILSFFVVVFFSKGLSMLLLLMI